MSTRSKQDLEKLVETLKAGKATKSYLTKHHPGVDAVDLLLLVLPHVLSGKQQLDPLIEETLQVQRDTIKDLLGTYQILQMEVTQLTSRVGELESKLASQAEEQKVSPEQQQRQQAMAAEIESQEERLLRMEAYSARNTILMAGLPDSAGETEEDLKTATVEVLKEATGLAPAHIGHVHRNGKWREGAKSRTVTVVLTHGHMKDCIMKKENKKKIKEKKKVALYHRMSPALQRRKKELEDLPEVDWVYFAGHRMFTVCKTDGTILHNVTKLSAL